MLAADAWCAAFVWPIQRDEPEPLTTGVLRRLQDTGELGDSRRDKVEELAEQYNFFHWHLAFPEVFGDERDGFDVVLGNPPWEHTELKEKEWFATRRPEIAQARTGALRKKYIQALQEDDPTLFQAFAAAKRQHDATGHFATSSGMYPLCGRGRINTYPLFAELGRTLIGSRGRVGNILPSGIATDDTTKFFFQDLVERRSLVSLLDFENRQGIFPGVHRSYKFCLLTLTGADRPANEAEFVFFALNPSDVRDSEKRFTLTPEDIALLNPNTKTCPVFRTRRDAEITKAIYRRVPVLVNEVTGENPWGISFMRMFDMSNDSGLFRTREDLEREGFELRGLRFQAGSKIFGPMHEGRLGHQYNHRYASESASSTRELGVSELASPVTTVDTQYYAPLDEYEARISRRNPQCRTGLLGLRRVARNTDERTAIAVVLPPNPATYGWILALGPAAPELTLLCTLFNSFAFDYVLRGSLSQPSIPQGTLQQLAVPTRATIEHSGFGDLASWAVSRGLELSYTSWDLAGFANEVGYAGAPFCWDEERRFWLRAELDAAYFHLYGIS